MPKLVSDLEPYTIFQIEGEEALTKRRLIDAGERLMGFHGIEAPTLQEIAAEAGQANKFAVQYHFGDRAGFVDAIFALRMRRIKARRFQLVEQAERMGLGHDLGSLLEAVFIPLSEQVDEKGNHSYARLVLQYTSRIGFDPASKDDPFNAGRSLVLTLMERMANILGLSYEAFELGFYQQHFAMVIGLVARDSLTFLGRPTIPLAELIDQTVVMAVPALEAVAQRIRQSAGG